MTDELAVERRGAVAIVTLARPEKLNALTAGLCAALTEVLGRVGADGARSVVLTGAGERAFCAGFDVTALPAPGDLEAIRNQPFDPLIEAVSGCRLPIVCGLNGVAFGGGCELAATCDLRVAHTGVSLAMPPAKLGIVYAMRGLARFSALVGESRARELFLTARTVTAQEALGWGLVDRVVPAEQVLSEAVTIAEQMAELAPLAVQGMRAGFEALMRQRVALAAAELAELEQVRLSAWSSQDAAEARTAFAHKRPPKFRGR